MISIVKNTRFLFLRGFCLYLCGIKLVYGTELTSFRLRFSLTEAISADPFKQSFSQFQDGRTIAVFPQTQFWA